DQFVRHYCAHYNRPLLELDRETLRLLSQYDWPGNVRELGDLVEHAVMLGDPRALRPASADREAGRAAPDPSAAASLSIEAAGPATAPRNVAGSLKEIARRAARVAEREVILRTLQQTRWNRRQAAERLGVSYKALLYKIKAAEFDPAS